MKIDDNIETVTCRICGEQCKRIYGKHLTFAHSGMTTKEYKNLFPDAPIMALSDRKNTTKNSGKHMKDEKYRKIFSEMYKGENNPNHKSKTTSEQRKSRSPFSKSFVKYNGVENVEEHLSEFVRSALADRINTTSVEYYINKGYSLEEATKLLSERQRTFTLEKCISKYGEEQGLERWIERQNKWQKSLIENGNIKCGYSSISQELFYTILAKYDFTTTDMSKIYFATKNKEYFISKSNIGFFTYDFTDLNQRKIIEYNGDNYHANPDIYDENDYPHPYYKENGPTAKEIWDRDSNKIKLAEKEGFEILIVWDSEYRKDKNYVIKKCLDFLKKY